MKKAMNNRKLRGSGKGLKGFTLIEVVVCIALMAVAVLGLAEMFTIAVLNNMRSDRITNATFLAQQQIDVLRNLTNNELTLLVTNPNIDLNNDGTPDLFKNELIDINRDTTNDYRRLTLLRANGVSSFDVIVYIFSPEQFQVSDAALMANPTQYGVKALVSTIIGR